MVKYGNWIPIWLRNTILIGLVILFGLSIFFFYTGSSVLELIFSMITIIYALFTLRVYYMYKEFDYSKSNSMAWKIIKYVASFVKVNPGEKILDIGCGSGALTIECAKRNKDSIVVGMDRWGAEYNAFSKEVCELNASEEKINNIKFIQGDITKLNLEKESFDFITSNYVIHNVPGDRVEMLVNILSLLKKGGSFAIHDLFSERHYGSPDQIIKKLNDMGFKKVKFVSTTDGKPMTKKDAKKLMLSKSKLLIGIK